MHGKRDSTLPLLLGGAALLAASAYLSHRMSARALAQNPPRGRFVAVEGVRLHYTEHGDPAHPPLVLLHGNGAMARELELSGLVEEAASRYHVFVFDRPGYGYSDRPQGRRATAQAQAELLLGALRRLDITRAVVLGHSWGTLVACWMALLQPSAVRALVLVSGYYTPSVRFDVPLLAVPALPVVGTLMRHTLSPLLARLLWPLMLRRLFAPAAVSQAFREGYPVWLSLRPGQLRASAAESAMMLPEALRLRRREHELRVPTVIVAGESDRLVMTGWQSRRLHQRLPGSDLHIVPGAGHMVHHTAPAAVVAAIDASLRERQLAGAT
jgi:pimeloyl-ACP methyl ester carboxylesterase